MKTIFPLYPMSNIDRWNNIMDIISRQSTQTQRANNTSQCLIDTSSVKPAKSKNSIKKYFVNLNLNKIISRKVK